MNYLAKIGLFAAKSIMFSAGLVVGFKIFDVANGVAQNIVNPENDNNEDEKE